MFHMNKNLKVVLAVEPVDLRGPRLRLLSQGMTCLCRTHSCTMRDMGFTREHFDRMVDEGMVLRSENDQLKTENLLVCAAIIGL